MQTAVRTYKFFTPYFTAKRHKNIITPPKSILPLFFIISLSAPKSLRQCKYPLKWTKLYEKNVGNNEGLDIDTDMDEDEGGDSFEGAAKE